MAPSQGPVTAPNAQWVSRTRFLFLSFLHCSSCKLNKRLFPFTSVHDSGFRSLCQWIYCVWMTSVGLTLLSLWLLSEFINVHEMNLFSPHLNRDERILQTAPGRNISPKTIKLRKSRTHVNISFLLMKRIDIYLGHYVVIHYTFFFIRTE